jgi:hypothetical protein
LTWVGVGALRLLLELPDQALERQAEVTRQAQGREGRAQEEPPLSYRRRMATAKWFRFDCGIHQPLVVAPAELALAWPGKAPTGQFSVYLTYWQPVMAELRAALPALAWEGHADTPYVVVDSEAAAKAIVAQLAAFLKAKDPATTAKRKQSMTTFTSGDDWKLVGVFPVSGSQRAVEAGETTGKGEWTWPSAGDKGRRSSSGR